MLRSPYVSECVVVGIMNDKKKDYDIVALVYPDKEYIAEKHGGHVSDETLVKLLAEVVNGVNEIVQTYKRIDMMIIRSEEFAKNSSKKIKRIGLVEAIMDDYIKLRG